MIQTFPLLVRYIIYRIERPLKIQFSMGVQCWVPMWEMMHSLKLT